MIHTRTISAYVIMLIAIVLPYAHAQQVWPNEAPERWGLAIIDVETTGLDPAHNEMIDLGAVYTDVDGNVLGEFFIRIMPEHPDRTAPEAAAINGFSEERWVQLGAVSPGEAVRRFLHFHERMSTNNERIWLLTGYNVWFDRGFMDALLENNGSSTRALYHYFQLDLPSQAWGLGVQGLSGREVAKDLGIEPETDNPLLHTGISGARWNTTVYRKLLKLDAIKDQDIAAQNRAMGMRVFAALEIGDVVTLNQVFAPDGESIIGSTIRPRGGPHKTFAEAAPFPAALDNRSVEVETIFADENHIAVQSKICGDHARALAGFAPTGKRICARYTNLYTVENGFITKNAVGFDRDLRPTLEKNARAE